MTTPEGSAQGLPDDDVERFVLIDGEEKPISLAVAFELAKIEAHTYMDFHGNRQAAKHAIDGNANQLGQAGFPLWFVSAYREGARNCINRIMVTE